MLLSYCCVNNLFIEQMDVETAFLNGKVKSEVYIHEPEVYEMNLCVSALGFIRSNYDYCLYVNNTDDDTINI